MTKQDKIEFRDRIRFISQNHTPHQPVKLFVSDDELIELTVWCNEANRNHPDSHPDLILQPCQVV